MSVKQRSRGVHLRLSSAGGRRCGCVNTLRAGACGSTSSGRHFRFTPQVRFRPVSKTQSQKFGKNLRKIFFFQLMQLA